MSIIADRPGKENPAGWNSLPGEILQRLAQEGINSAEDWCALSRARRRSIFGITPLMVTRIDTAALP